MNNPNRVEKENYLQISDISPREIYSLSDLDMSDEYNSVLSKILPNEVSGSLILGVLSYYLDVELLPEQRFVAQGHFHSSTDYKRRDIRHLMKKVGDTFGYFVKELVELVGEAGEADFEYKKPELHVIQGDLSKPKPKKKKGKYMGGKQRAVVLVAVTVLAYNKDEGNERTTVLCVGFC